MNNGYTLTLKDSDPSKTHYVTLNNYIATAVADTGTETTVTNGTGTVKVSGGYITGGTHSRGSALWNKGTVNLYGGVFIGNTGQRGTVYTGVQNGVSGTTKVYDGCVITYNSVSSFGGAIHVEKGSVTVNGGTFSYNHANGYGGAIHGTNTINGGSFTGNSAGTGGAISGPATINGGNFTGNTSNTGAISLYGTGQKLQVSGSPTITGNFKSDGVTPCNVYCEGGAQIKVTAELASNAQIGVTMKTPGTLTTGSTDSLKASTYKDNFFSDNNMYCVQTTDKELTLGHNHIFNYSATDETTITGTCQNTALTCDIPNKTATLTIATPTSLAYDSTPKEAVITDENGIQGDAEVRYFAADENGEKIGDALAGAPADAGKYWAEITLGEGEGAATVHVVYEITDLNYSVTVQPTENGTVTADKTSAKFDDVVTLTVTPAEGKELTSINATCGVLTQMPLDSPTEKLTYTLTGITEDTTVTATFGKLETYTVLYNATGNPAQVYSRVGTDSTGYKMTQNVTIGNLNCWAVPTQAAADSETLSVSFSTDGTTWGNTVNANVTDSVPTTLTEGQTVAVRGDAKIFALAFASDDATTVSQYYLVTPDTTSITVPNPQKDGYIFEGWTYNAKSASEKPEEDKEDHNQLIAAGNGSTEVPVKEKFIETTILSAHWKLSSCNVTYDLNGGSGSAPSATVSYGNKATKPTDPTKSGYAFVRWVVAKNTTQRIGNSESTMLAGTAFDFANTSVINDLKLKAEWKHVHSYVCLPLDHSAFGGAFNEYVRAGYKNYLHIKICTSVDDYFAEAHSFDRNGRCACGYTKPEPKVTLTKVIDNGTPTTVTTTQNQVVSISAPQTSNGKKFARWEYSGDGQKWMTLTPNSYAAFAIPQNMYVRAVYDAEKVTVLVESFMDDGKLVFFFNYSVPDGWKVLDGGLLTGDNSNLRYMEVRYGGRATPYYMPRSDNAIASLGAATVGERIFREQPLSGGGKPTPTFKRPSVLGKSACCAVTYPKSLIANYNGNYNVYGMGYIVCKKPDGSTMGYKIDAIWASKNSPNHKIYDVWNAN